MNRIARHLTRFTMIAAVLAAALSVQSTGAAERAPRLVELPTVTVVAKRIQPVELERVVIVAKRLSPEPELMAQRAARSAKVATKV